MNLRRILLLAGGVALVLGIAGWRDVSTVRARLDEVRTSLVPAEEAASSFEIDALRAALGRAKPAAAEAHRAARSPAMTALSFVPVAGRSVRTVRALASAADHAVEGADALLDALDEFPKNEGKLAYGLSGGRLDLAPWTRARQAAGRAMAEVLRADEQLSSAPKGFVIGPLTRAREEAASKVTSLVNAVSAFDDATRLVPASLGADGPRRYLVVLQNLAEQRATGGIPGGTMLFETDKGALHLREITSNLELIVAEKDVPQPAWFRNRYDRVEGRRLWVNSNVEADFRVTGANMAALYEELTGEETDGVIAIDAFTLAELLRVTGPVRGPRGVTVNSDNITDLIHVKQYEMFPGIHDVRPRKLFLEALAGLIWERFSEDIDMTGARDAFGRAAAGRHLSLWSSHPEEQAVFERIGIAGAVGDTGSGPSIAVITQSGSGNKMDTYLRRTVRVVGDRQGDGLWHFTLRVSLANTGRDKGLPRYVLGPDPTVPDYSPGFIRTYLSFYVPEAAFVTEMRVDGEPSPHESERAPHALIVSDFLVMRPGETREVELDLRFAGAPGGAAFDLTLQKQPTVVPDQVEIAQGTVTDPQVIRPLGLSEGQIVVRIRPREGALRRLSKLLTG